MPWRSPAARILVPLGALLLAGCGSGSKQSLALLGADCLAGRDAACSSGTCLVLDSSTAYCSQSCAAQKDCPDGYLCLPSGGANLCQARGAGGVCGVDDDCPAGLRCDTGPGRCYVPVTRSACGSCTSDKQCGAGGACHSEGSESFCATACGTGDTCATGYTCKAGAAGKTCLPSGGSCRGGRSLCSPCTGDLECGKPGDLCVRNLISDESFCAQSCTANADCPKSFSCVDLSGKGDGPTQCVPDSGTCQGYCDSSDAATVKRECGLGASCNTTNHACARATDGTLCATCVSDDDCTKASAGNRCLVNRTAGSPFLGERFCGIDCTMGSCTGASCAPDPSKCTTAGFSCVGIGPQGKWPYQCAPARGSCQGGFGRLGDACDRHGAGDCVSSICGQFGMEKRCSASCSADADCGDARFHCCAAVGTDKYDCSKPAAGAGGGVCAPVGGSFGDDCSPGHAPCQDGYCLDIGTAQLCTKGCAASASCPTGFSCQGGQLIAADGTTAGAVQVCFPDGGGGVGSACTFGPAACKSHLCIKKDSGNVCTINCTSATDCPADWTCGAETTVTNDQVNVCLPPGTGS